MTKTNKKIASRRPQHRLPLYRRAWFLVLVTLAIIAIVVAFIIFVVKPRDNRPAEGTSTSDTPTITSKPAPYSNDDAPKSNPDQVVVQYEGEDPNTASDLSGSISYTDYSAGVLSIGTMIDQYLTDGTCELRATGSTGQVYTATSDIVPAASTSACRELSVAVANGAYTIEITLHSNDKQGIIKQEVGPWD